MEVDRLRCLARAPALSTETYEQEGQMWVRKLYALLAEYSKTVLAEEKRGVCWSDICVIDQVNVESLVQNGFLSGVRVAMPKAR